MYDTVHAATTRRCTRRACARRRDHLAGEGARVARPPRRLSRGENDDVDGPTSRPGSRSGRPRGGSDRRPALRADPAVRRPARRPGRAATPTSAPPLLERARNLPAVPLSLRAQYDLEMLAVGAFSPLDRFMAHDEYESVLYEMRLEDGELFPIPLAVPCREDALRGAPARSRVDGRAGHDPGAARGGRGLSRHDMLREMRAVLGGRDSAHPLVIEAKALAEPLPRRPPARARPAPTPAPRPAVPHAG